MDDEIIRVMDRRLVDAVMRKKKPLVALESLADESMPRSKAETDFNYVQPVVYVAVTDKSGRIAIYERKGGEKRLHGKLSIGIGGHVREGELIADAVFRELGEELGTSIEIDDIGFLGLYYSDDSDVDKVHIGVFFKAVVDDLDKASGDIEVRAAGEITPDDYARLEKWSKALIEMVTGGDKNG